MPAELPGFYFDPERRKYFKIQANNVAPTDSKYSAQAVNANKRLRVEVDKAQQYNSYVTQNRITRSKYLQNPRGLLLQRQLGDITTSSTDIMKRLYATNLQSRTVFSNMQSGIFAVEPASKQLFTVSSPRLGARQELCFNKHALTSVAPDSGEEESGMERPIWARDSTVPIYNWRGLRCLTTVSKDLVVWVADSMISVGTSVIYFSRRRDWGWPGQRYGEWGTTWVDVENDVIDVKAAPSGEQVVLAEAGRIQVCDINRGVRDGVWCWEAVEGVKGGRDFMCVDWKDENVVVSGTRSGEVWLADVRVGGGALRRMKCPWAVTAVSSMQKERVLVWGLQGGSVFDLRFTKPEGGTKKKGRNMTRATVAFDVKEPWMQKRYGMGWDYDEELGLVGSACTDLHRRHRVGLWDMSTGKMIQESPLVKKEFAEQVTCVQMIDLEERGGTKSILTACDRKIYAWEV